MKGIVMTMVGATLVVLCVAPMPAVVRGDAGRAQSSAQGASGSIEWRTAIGVEASATFSVRAHEGRGEIAVRNHDGVSFTGTILCYYRRSPSSASFSGRIDSFEGSNVPPNRQGTAAFRMSIQGGVAGTQGGFVALVRSATPSFCTAERLADRPITGGDFTIR